MLADFKTLIKRMNEIPTGFLEEPPIVKHVASSEASKRQMEKLRFGLWKSTVEPILNGFVPAEVDLSRALQFRADRLANRTHGETVFNNQLIDLKIQHKIEVPIFFSKTFFFIADFIIDDTIIIEIDGGTHLSKEASKKDAHRDRILEDFGFQTIRLWDAGFQHNVKRSKRTPRFSWYQSNLALGQSTKLLDFIPEYKPPVDTDPPIPLEKQIRRLSREDLCRVSYFLSKLMRERGC